MPSGKGLGNDWLAAADRVDNDDPARLDVEDNKLPELCNGNRSYRPEYRRRVAPSTVTRVDTGTPSTSVCRRSSWTWLMRNGERRTGWKRRNGRGSRRRPPPAVPRAAKVSSDDPGFSDRVSQPSWLASKRSSAGPTSTHLRGGG